MFFRNQVYFGKLPLKNPRPLDLFIFLFLLRYVRLIVHLVAFLAYMPTPVPKDPMYEPQDATVIIPSVEPWEHEFEECVRSVLANKAGKIIVVTVGKEKLALAEEVCSRLSRRIRVLSTDAANKRDQVVHGLRNSENQKVSPFYWTTTSFGPMVSYLLAARKKDAENEKASGSEDTV
jgi:hypothetical protein